MNRINEIGDTPRGQYMLGRLSQRYDEPNLYTDDYDEVPEIADYASRNWRKDGNARAFDLGKGDEANTKWVDDGNQRNFRKMHNLPQFENKQNNRIDMNKKLIRLTESDLHRIVKESVNRVLNEVEFRGRTFHGNMPDDWRKIAHIRNAYKMDADRGETDAINGYNHSFDSQDAKEAEYWRNASKKHSKNADRDMNNYRDMGNQ